MIGPVRQLLLGISLAAVYFLAGKFGLYFFGLIHPSASAVWPPTGVAIAALLVLGYRFWPAVLVGAFLVNVTTAGSVASSLGVALGNTLEAALAAYLVNRFASGVRTFERAADIVKFAALAGALSTAVSATVGVASLTLGGYADPAQLGSIWFTWWLGDAAGAILFAPLLVLLYVDRGRPWPLRRVGEGALLLSSLLAVSGIVFFLQPLASYPLAFLCLPPLVWAAFRFGQREVAASVAVLAIVATAATATGHGSFVMRTPNESLLVLQSFMILIALTALPMAALAIERAALLERERGAHADADAASRAKDEFLAILSHELRNPLSAIGAAATVLDRLPPHDERESLRWLAVIHRQTRHLARLIDDLLDVARVTVNKMNLKREPLELGTVVRRCVHSLTAAAVVSPSRIELDLETAWVDADPDRVEQIIDNLLGNAVKYTSAAGRIRVTVRVEPEQVLLRVEDDGVGIVRPLLPHVFDAFTQGGTAPARGGLGIGLTLVRRLTELHGGSVAAHSNGQGQGSVFSVRLPRAMSQVIGADADLSGPFAVTGRGCRLLVVEDNEDSREALRVLLESAGHEVHEARDGEAGIVQALRVLPDLALIDIGLPGLDGYEVARRLKAANADIRLVALTGFGRDEDVELALDAGFDAHLLKPVTFERLQYALQSTLQRDSPIAARCAS